MNYTPEPRRAINPLKKNPFFGRSELLASVVESLATPGSNSVLIGTGGAGKTSLGIRALQVLTERDPQLRIVHLAATEASQRTPLALFDAVLPEFDTLKAQRPEQLGKHIVRDCLELLTADSAEHPSSNNPSRPTQLILHIDDVPYLDQMSEAIVSYLLARTDVRVLLTCRTSPGLPLALVRAWRDGILNRIEIPELSQEETSEFIAARLPAEPFDTEAVTSLHQVTGGNPLFLSELLRMIDEAGSFAMKRGKRVWTAPLNANTSIIDLLRAEVAQLPPEQRGAFEIVALCSPVSVALLGTQVPPGALEALAANGLIALATPPGQQGMVATLTHPIYGEAITSLLTPPQISTHYRELYAEASARYRPQPNTATGERTPESPLLAWRGELPELLTVVGWGISAGCEVPVQLLEAAFQFGQHLTDFPFRLRITTATLGHPDTTPLLQAQVLVNRANAHHYSLNPAGVDADLPRCTAALDSLPPDLVRAQLVADLAALVTQSQVRAVGRWASALAHLDWAEKRVAETVVETASSDPAALAVIQAGLTASRCILLSYIGSFAESFELQQKLWENPAAKSDLILLISTSMITLGLRGDAKRSRTLAGKQLARSVLSIRDSPNAVGEAMASWCISAMFTGNLRESAAILKLLNAAIAQNPGKVRINKGALAGGQGLLETFQGEWAAAVRSFSLAKEQADTHSDDPSETLFLAALTLAQAASGDTEASSRSRERLKLQLENLSKLSLLPCRYFMLLASLYGPRSSAQTADAFMLAKLARKADFPLMELRALHIFAFCAPDDFTGEMLERAMVLETSIDAPLAAPLLASIRHLIGGGAPNTGEAARQLARRGVFLPSAHLAELTRREQQLAELIALGYSNKHIAKKLVLSKRTIDSHTSRIFQKLNVTSRDDLAEAFGELAG